MVLDLFHDTKSIKGPADSGFKAVADLKSLATAATSFSAKAS
jgi:hypothetical protein